MRYILIDRITEYEGGKMLKAIKNITFSDGVGRPRGANWVPFPAAFVMESMAQAAGLLVAMTIDYRAQPVLAKVQQMRVYDQAKPGDRLDIFAGLEDMQEAGARLYVKSSRDGVPLAEATVFLSLVSFEEFGMEKASEHRRMLRSVVANLAPEWFSEVKEASMATI
jgi:3-hydroxymyristoyl/3-hydroxydecanoyl-(acyl carrier protein) dehydratase